jgi:hypothetical protein
MDNNTIESLILIEGKDLNEETLRSLSLGNAKQLVVGRIPGGSIILHIAAESSAFLGAALLEFTDVSGITKVFTLAVETSQ